MKQARRQKAEKSAKSIEFHTLPFPVVGIGASAGGLEPITQLLKFLPPDTGMSFVLVQHLDPTHQSALTQILCRVTAMPVLEVTPNTRVEPNHVYVIPPDKRLSIEGGILRLHPRSNAGRAKRATIDFFFETLAHDQKDGAVGVILSGTATDGTLGLEAIKAEGGITFAQDESAAYDSMPRSAIAAGCVDSVLSPRNIAQELVRIAKHPSMAAEAKRAALVSDEAETRSSPRSVAEQDGRRKILLLLRTHSGVDFSQYKVSTVERRITRRMVLNKINTRDKYASFLRGNRQELDALYSDVLISVTGFFRDAESFEALKRKVFSKLLQRPQEEPFRAWVLGCSTGQEAYSLAMAFLECNGQTAAGPRLQVFATDVNEASLEKARAGWYSKNVVQDVSPARLRRFFIEEKGGYRVSKPLREMCVFARQNLISDPPFSRMNLICCRNVLIYLENDIQRKVLPSLHYALRTDGILFLGASESVGSFANLFETVDKKHRIFSKKPVPTPTLRLSFARLQPATRETPSAKPLAQGLPPELNAQREADRVLLNRCAPPGLLIDEELQVLQFRGDTSPYLQPPIGAATLHVLKMAREGLIQPLQTAINEAKKGNRIISRKNISFKQNGRRCKVSLEIIPLKNLKERCSLILFEQAEHGRVTAPTPSAPFAANPSTSTAPASRHIAELESELAESRDYAQALQEEHQAGKEEMQSQSEELQSANEELQSINEELETSKEELESTNEELITLNEEVANRNVELNRLNNDLKNLSASINTAIVLLGRDLSIRSFTPFAEGPFNLLQADVGRPLSRIRHNLDCPDLEEIITTVMDTMSVQEREVRDKEGRWYSLRVRPYVTLDNKLEGAVLMLVDIDALKRSSNASAAARDYAESILLTVRNPLLVLTGELRVHSANAAFYKTFGVSPTDTEGRLIYELGDGQWNIPKLREFLDGILSAKGSFDDFEVTHDFQSIGQRTMLLNARLLQNQGEPRRLLLGIDDMTESKRMEAMAEQARLLDLSNDAIVVCDWNDRISYWNKGAEELYGYAPHEMKGKVLWEVLRTEFPEPYEAILAKLERNDRWSGEVIQTHRDGRRSTVAARWAIARDAEARPSAILRTFSDITERKQDEAALRNARDRLANQAAELERLVKERTSHLRETVGELEAFSYSLAHDLRAPLRSMIGFSQTLLEEYAGKMDARAGNFLQRIVRSSSRLDRLVQDVLNYTKILKTPAATELVDLDRLLRDILETYPEYQPPRAQIQIESTLPQVLGNEAFLTQCISNLLSNAVKFVSPGTIPCVRIWAEPKNGQVRLCFQDNGIGIAAQKHDRIFRMFERINPTAEYEGTGIGLTIARKAAQRMGGEIGFRSELGKGSTFWIQLQKG